MSSLFQVLIHGEYKGHASQHRPSIVCLLRLVDRIKTIKLPGHTPTLQVAMYVGLKKYMHVKKEGKKETERKFIRVLMSGYI